MNVQLIADDFRNSTFEDNLELLRTEYPDIHAVVKDHKPESYKLCLNPDGTPNIVCMSEKTVLYPTSAEAIDAFHDHKVLSLFRKVDFPPAFLLQGRGNHTEHSPVQTRAYSELLGIKPIEIEEVVGADDHMDCRVKARDVTYLPLVRVYGVGLGTQLLKLLKDKTVVFLSVVEPDLDLFFASLFVTPWRILHQYFSVRNKEMSLIVGDTPENSIERESAFIQQAFPFLTSNFGRLIMSSEEALRSRLVSAERAQDAKLYNSSSAGWYDDQKLGLYNSLRNLKARRRFFTGKRVAGFLRIFIVGSGPSLDDSISYIRKHVDHAVILACGSAVSPLLAAGIIPDFHIIQERAWEKDWVHGPEDQHIFRKIRLLKLNVVSPKNDSFYKDTFVFQKFMDPGSALLGAGFPATQGVNPTVTNSGVAFAIELDADEVYLFGVDYGSPAGRVQWHSRNTLYDREGLTVGYSREEAFEIKGNFAVPVLTTPILSWSLEVAETIIARHAQAKWINVGDGAHIAGTEESLPESLPDLPLLPISKNELVSEIESCFSDAYTTEERFQNFDEVHKPAIEAYLNNLRLFHGTTVSSREEIIDVLSMLYEAVDVGYDNTDFIPSSLLNGGIKRLIENIFLRSSLAASDAEAVNFFEEAVVVLDEYYTAVLKDLDYVVQSANNGVEIVNWSRDTKSQAQQGSKVL